MIEKESVVEVVWNGLDKYKIYKNYFLLTIKYIYVKLGLYLDSM